MENEESRWGLLNVYAPNHASARARLWEEIYLALPEDVENWIVGGDFNMLEDPQDRRGGSMTTIQGLELANWERLVRKLRIYDMWHLSNFHKGVDSLRFSRSDRRTRSTQEEAAIGSQNLGGTLVPSELSQGGPNESRIDRFYLSDVLATKEGMITILPGTTLSDHAPIILSITPGQQWKKGRSQLRIPDRILEDGRYKEEVEKLWNKISTAEGNSIELLDEAVLAMSNFFKEQTKQQAEVREKKGKNMRRSLKALQRLQERHPTCSWIRYKMAEAKR